jgi:hypothetical protein
MADKPGHSANELTVTENQNRIGFGCSHPIQHDLGPEQQIEKAFSAWAINAFHIPKLPVGVSHRFAVSLSRASESPKAQVGELLNSPNLHRHMAEAIHSGQSSSHRSL